MRIMLVMVLFGIGIVVAGVQEFRLGQGVPSEPVETGLAALENGEAPPAFNMKLDPHMAVYPLAVYSYSQSKYESGPPTNSTSIDYCYVPVVSMENPWLEEMSRLVARLEAGDLPPDTPTPTIDNLAVLIKTERFETLGDIPDLIKQEDGCTGLIINKISSLDDEEARLVQQSFPSTDLDKVLILEEGREPASFLKSFGMMGGGVLLVLGGIWIAFGGSGSKRSRRS